MIETVSVVGSIPTGGRYGRKVDAAPDDASGCAASHAPRAQGPHNRPSSECARIRNLQAGRRFADGHRSYQFRSHARRRKGGSGKAEKDDKLT